METPPNRRRGHPREAMHPHQAYGGAALEYVLVSTFAAVAGVAALSFVGKMMQTRLIQLADRLGVEIPVEDLDPFGDGD